MLPLPYLHIEGVFKVDENLDRNVSEAMARTATEAKNKGFYLDYDSDHIIFKLDISYEDREKAKKCGAFWNKPYWRCNYHDIFEFHKKWTRLSKPTKITTKKIEKPNQYESFMF